MEDTIFLLILSICSLIIGFLLDRYGFGKFKPTKDEIIKALEDKKITKEELLDILNQLEEDIKT